ncbi:MAG: recombinase family protein [Chloroflexota bacterium]
MKAIGYFSAQGKAQGEAVLLGQQEAFSSHCQRHGHQSLATFVEYDLDGEGRSRYQDMLDYLKQSDSEFLVIVAGTQYLGDTLESSVRRVLEMDALGAKVICSDDDLPDPLQQALKHWKGVRVGGAKGEHIKEAMMAKAVRGEGLGKPPFGYRIGPVGKLEVISDEGATVRLIFDLYTQENMGMRRIVRHLNERGVPTRSGGGWSIVTVRDMLRNRTYLGTYTRFGMRVPRSHQAIIDSNEFNLTQQRMAREKTARVLRPGEPFLLSGLVYCASCGNRMIGVSRRQGWRRKDGSQSVGQYRYYQCQSRTNQGMCRYHTWRSNDLERRVLDQVKEVLEKGEARLRLSESAPQRRLDAEKNAKRLETQFLKALESAAAGITSLERLRFTLEEVDAQRSTPMGDLSPENPLAEAIASGDPSSLLQSWDSLDKDTVGHMLRALVSRVTVGDDSVQLSLNSSEE